MKELNKIKGIIFDYGGTIDTNSRHWAEVLWEKYAVCGVPVSKDTFREAYVHGERSLARHPYVQINHDFHDVLRIKTAIQMDYLATIQALPNDEQTLSEYATKVADACHDYVLETLKTTRPVVEVLAARFPLVLVSNFYGNIGTILHKFSLELLFRDVVESSVVGVRKPDPAIFRLGVDSLGLPAGEILVVGDSFTKDILPARSLGCRTAWLKGEGWGGEETDDRVPDVIITSLAELPPLLSPK